MTGLEIAAATYVFGWAKRRGKSAAERAGGEADTAFGLLMDRLHDLIARKLAPADSGLARLEREADSRDEPSPPALNAVAANLEAEAAEDPDFAAALAKAVAALDAARGAGNVYLGPTAVQTGDHNTQHNHFGA